MRRALLGFLAIAALSAPGARADESISPYIDELKQEMAPKKGAEESAPEPGVVDPYIQSIKKKMQEKEGAPEQGTQPYIDQLKEGMKPKPEEPADAYIQDQKAKLGPGHGKSAIEAVKQGDSELEAKKIGKIHNAVGFRYGTFLNRSFSAADQLQSFDSMYGSNYAPDFTLFYEYQPFHSEWFGNIGLLASLGVGYYHGSGVYQFPLKNAVTGASFPAQSQTVFQLFNVPATVGIDYRFNLARLLRPFVTVGPSAIAFIESRNDNVGGHQVVSTGIFTGGGVSILLDWIAPNPSWDLYSQFKVLHYYLTVEYDRLNVLSGPVTGNVSGVNVGLTFEY